MKPHQWIYQVPEETKKEMLLRRGPEEREGAADGREMYSAQKSHQRITPGEAHEEKSAVRRLAAILSAAEGGTLEESKGRDRTQVVPEIPLEEKGEAAQSDGLVVDEGKLELGESNVVEGDMGGNRPRRDWRRK